MNQRDQIRYWTPAHVVDVRGHGNLCPSDCGNRSLTGHADSAVCNQWQLVCVQHFTMSDNSGSITCHFSISVVTECRSVQVCIFETMFCCGCALVVVRFCRYVLLWICAFVDVWMCVHVRF